MGFEPTRAEHNGLAVHRLNHSATSSWCVNVLKDYCAAMQIFLMTSCAWTLTNKHYETSPVLMPVYCHFL